MNLLIFNLVFCLSILFVNGEPQVVNDLGEFDQIVQNQPYVLTVVSKKGACPHCKYYEQVINENVKELEDDYQCQILFVHESDAIIERYNLKSKIPRIIVYREGIPALYNSPELLPSDLLYWIFKARDSRVQILDDQIFEHLTQASSGATTGDWLVAFVDQIDEASRAKFEGIQVTFLDHGINVAFVDYEKNINLRKRFAITENTILLFKQGKMYRFVGNKWDARAIVEFVGRNYRHAKAEKIPVQSSTFDYVLDTSVRLVKENLEPIMKQYIVDLSTFGQLLAFGCFSVILVTFLICGCVTNGPKNPSKVADKKKTS